MLLPDVHMFSCSRSSVDQAQPYGFGFLFRKRLEGWEYGILNRNIEIAYWILLESLSFHLRSCFTMGWTNLCISVCQWVSFVLWNQIPEAFCGLERCVIPSILCLWRWNTAEVEALILCGIEKCIKRACRSGPMHEYSSGNVGNGGCYCSLVWKSSRQLFCGNSQCTYPSGSLKKKTVFVIEI